MKQTHKHVMVKFPTAWIYCVNCRGLLNKEDLKLGCARCQWRSDGFDLPQGHKKEDYQVFVNNFRNFKKVKN